ncbi:MAG: oligosaccharide flippase family protein [Actinomycetota bacterium]|nr:oligosaccharide flippase family protein [Actinomycetota bacterium]
MTDSQSELLNSATPAAALVKGNDDAATVLRHALRYLPTRAAPALFGLATAPILTRALRPDGYGRYTLLLLVASYASVVFGEWVIAGYQRFVLSGDAKEREAAEEAFAWTVFTLLTGSLVSVPFVVFSAVEVRDFLAVLALIWGLTLFQLVITRFVMAEDATAATVVQLLATALRFVVALAAALVVHSAAAVVLSAGLSLLLLSVVVLMGQQSTRLRLRVASLQLLASFGAFMLLTSVALNALATVDRFLLARLTTASVVGRYSAAYLLSEQAVLVLPSVLFLAVTPRVTALWEQGRREEAGRLCTSIALLHLEICVPIVAALVLYGGAITRLAFGPAFQDASVPPLIAIGAVFLAISTYANLGLRMQKRTARQAAQAVAGLAVNVLLVLVLVPPLGATGAALATLAAYLAVAAWALVDNRFFFDCRRLFSGSLPILVPAAALLGVHAALAPARLSAVATAAYAGLAAIRLFRGVRLSFIGAC